MEGSTSEAVHKHSSLLERLGMFKLLLISFLLPVLVIPMQVIPFTLTKTVLVTFGALLLFVLFIVSRILAKEIHFPKSAVVPALLLLPIAAFVSALFSGVPMLGIFGQMVEGDTAFFTLALAILALLFPFFLRTKSSVFSFYMAVFAAFFVSTLFLVIRLAFGASVLSFGYFTNVVGNLIGGWNDVGVFAGLIVVLSLLALEILPARGNFKWFLYTALVAGLGLLVVVNFSFLWYVIAAFTGFSVLYQASFGRKRAGVPFSFSGLRSVVSVPALASLILALVFIFFGSSISPKISAALSISQIQAWPAWSSTISVAQNSLASHPFFGFGPSNFFQAWGLYKPISVNQSAFWGTDFSSGIGVIPSSLVTMGLVGGLAWLIFLIVFLYQGGKALFRKRDDSTAHYLSFLSFAGALYMLVISFSYNPSVALYALLFAFVGVFLASLVAEGAIGERKISLKDPRLNLVGLVIGAVLIVGSLAGLYFAGAKTIALYHFNRALVSYGATQDLTKAETEVRAAIQTAPSDVYYRALSEIAIISLNNFLQTVTQENAASQRDRFTLLSSGAIGAAQAAKDANPNNYQNWIALARAYGVLVPLQIQGAYDESKKAYEKALELNPTNPGIPLSIAQLDLSANKSKEAKDSIRAALALKSNYTDAIFLLSQIQINEGDLKEAINSVTAASQVDPNNPVVFFQLGFLKYNNKDYQGAETALNRAVQLEPSYANARYFLGLSLNRLGRNSEAITQFAEIQKTNPDNQEVKFILANLQAGRSPFANVAPPLDDKPEKRKTPPVSENKKSADTPIGN
jgi:tetratricopeptide (TPR) repeat protein